MTRDAHRRSHGATLFDTWKEYEHIAMHFNDLLIRLRSRALAAAGGFATIAGVLLKSATIAPRVRWESKAGVFFALSVLWVAIWVLDFTYYHQLLRGAVKALLDLEDSSGGELFLSKEIEASVRQGKKYGRGTTAEAAKSVPMVPMKRPGGLWWFYGLVFVVLLAATGGSGYAATRTPNAANAAAAASLSR